jgi:HPt (histidine-containing phosphotransfer) domain-containing protein
VDWPTFTEVLTDVDETQKNVHKIKGVAGNLSESYIYRYAAEFESSLRLNRPDAELYAKLRSSCDEFKVRVMSSVPEANANLPKGTAKEFWKRIDEMKEALLSYDLKSCSKAADRLKEMNWLVSSANRALTERLCEFADAYDYDAALIIIEEMTQ